MISKRNGANIILNMQYIKDFSFKNNIALEVFNYKDLKPKMDVSIDLNATKVQNEIFDLSMNIDIVASNDSKNVFSFNLVYSGVFTITNVEQSLIQENLFIDCPTILFPFARSIISNMSLSANLPPVVLDVIDFEDMYNSKKDTL